MFNCSCLKAGVRWRSGAEDPVGAAVHAAAESPDPEEAGASGLPGSSVASAGIKDEEPGAEDPGEPA